MCTNRSLLGPVSIICSFQCSNDGSCLGKSLPSNFHLPLNVLNYHRDQLLCLLNDFIMITSYQILYYSICLLCLFPMSMLGLLWIFTCIMGINMCIYMCICCICNQNCFIVICFLFLYFTCI